VWPGRGLSTAARANPPPGRQDDRWLPKILRSAQLTCLTDRHLTPLPSGIMDCVRQIISRDGYFGLYRGIGPNMLKAVPSISISYAVFETCSTYLHGMVI
jgi:hypothetical protein